MKKTIILIMFAATFAACTSESSSSHIDTSVPTDLSTELDSVSYSLGMGYGSWLKTNIQMDHLSNKAFLSAVQRALEGKESEISKEDEKALMTKFMASVSQREEESRAIEDAALAEKYADRKVNAEKWLAEMKAQPGVKELEPGLYYKVVKAGTGPKPVDGDGVSVLYTGKLADGTIFDSTEEDGKPRQFGVNGVIPGWTKALKEMNTGSKWIVYISPDLGYGLRPRSGGAIQPNDALLFEVELLEVLKPQQPQQ